MIVMPDLYWLAGLLEGEGSFMFVNKQGCLRISLGMTDRDVIERAAKITGSKSIYESAGTNKPIFTIDISGKRAAGWMMTMLPLMGIRRATKIVECLSEWKKRSAHWGRYGVKRCLPDGTFNPEYDRLRGIELRAKKNLSLFAA